MEQKIRKILCDMDMEIKSNKSYTGAYLNNAVEKLLPLVNRTYTQDCPMCGEFKKAKHYMRIKPCIGHDAWGEEGFFEAAQEDKIFCQHCGKKYI